MKLTILGGGGFRVPLVYGALLGDRGEGRVTDVVLHDLDAGRLSAVARVLAEQADGVARRARRDRHHRPRRGAARRRLHLLRDPGRRPRRPRGRRAGRPRRGRPRAGDGRRRRHRVRAAHGPRRRGHRPARGPARARRLGHQLHQPGGLVTEAMSRHLGDRVIGICDSPVGLGRRVARVLGADPARPGSTTPASTTSAGSAACTSPAATSSRGCSPTRTCSAPSRRASSSAPTGSARSARSRTSTCTTTTSTGKRSAPTARPSRPAARSCATSRQRFYEEMRRPDASALTAWDRTRAEREATYMAENREAAGAGERDADDLDPAATRRSRSP